jgi:hypothetical protein
VSSPAVEHLKIGTWNAPMPRSATRPAGFLNTEPTAVAEGEDTLSISRLSALGGVRGAMWAVAFEAAAVIFLYGAWKLWLIVR